MSHHTEEPAVERHAGHDGGHGVLAQTKMNVPSRVAPDATGRSLRRHPLPGYRRADYSKSPHPFIAVRVDGSRSAEPADEVRHHAGQRVDDLLRRRAWPSHRPRT